MGDGLPSVRGLAAELVINHNTVAKAYSQLVLDGVIESQQGRGYFVAKRREIYTKACLLYTSPSPRDLSTSRMPSSA